MTVDELYKLVQYATGKNTMQGFVTSDDFNRIINVGMRSYIAYLLGNFQTYAPGRAIAKVELGMNSVIRQRMVKAIKKVTLTIDGSGNVNYPSDYLQADAMLTSDNKRVRYVQQDSLYSYLDSGIDPVATNPIYLIEDVKFQFYPITLGSAKLSYIANPPSIKWAFTLDGNGRQVYDAGNSVQPVFDDLGILEIATRALKVIGVNLMLPVVQQYAKDIETNGQ